MTDIKVCAVCGIVLDRLDPTDDPESREWMHTLELLGLSDHVAVPVDYDAIPVNVLCDFCYVLIPDGRVMIVPSEPFDIPYDMSRSMGNWSACEECAELIGRRRWTQLVNRAADGYAQEVKRLGEPAMPRSVLKREFLEPLYERLQVHLTGPPRPWRVGDEQDVNP